MRTSTYLAEAAVPREPGEPTLTIVHRSGKLASMGRAGDSREFDRDARGPPPPAAVPSAGEPPSALPRRIRELQRTAGNQAVGRLLARTVARQVEAPAAVDLGAVADEIYEALDGWNDEARAIRALEGHDAGARAEIKSQFSLSFS